MKVSYYLYLKIGIFFQKSPDFFSYFSRSYAVSMDNRYIVPKKYYHTISVIDTSDLLQEIESFVYAETLFNRIADFIIKNIDSSVELRGVNKK